MKKKAWIWILVAIIVGVLIFRVTSSGKEKLTSVKTETVSKGDIKAYLSTTATIKSKYYKEYYGLQAKVKKVNVKVGDKVEKNQVLVAYETQDMATQIKQLEIQYANAKLSKQMLINRNSEMKNKIADVNKQLSDLDSQIAALKKSGNPTDTAKAATLEQQKSSLSSQKDQLKTVTKEEFEQADNGIALAKLNLDNARQNLSKSQDSLVAENSGVVTSINVVEGSVGNMAQPAVIVQDIDDLKGLVYVGKYDADKIQIGQDVIVKSGDKEYKGKVSFINPIAKTSISPTGGESTLGIEIDILEKGAGLKIDFDADADILLGQVQNTLRVPAECIRTDKNGRNYVYVIENQKAVERDVQLGLQSDMEAQVVSGLKEGDKAILNPSKTIVSGTMVRDEAEVTK